MHYSTSGRGNTAKPPLDYSNLPDTHRAGILPWALFGNAKIASALVRRGTRYETVVATGAALSALLGITGTGTATAPHIARMIRKDVREVREALRLLARFDLWANTRRRPACEWWVLAGQIPLFAEDRERDMVPTLKARERDMVPTLKARERDMVPTLNDGAIRSITKKNNDDVVGSAAEAEIDPDPVRLSSLFLQENGWTEADADLVARAKPYEWIVERWAFVARNNATPGRRPIDDPIPWTIGAATAVTDWPLPGWYRRARELERRRAALPAPAAIGAQLAGEALTDEDREASLRAMRAASAGFRKVAAR